MTLIVLPVERPLDLIGQPNGEIDDEFLTTVPGGGRLYLHTARSWLALVAEARTAGWALTFTPGGCYRPLAAQVTLFLQRYTTTPLAGRPTKVWNGTIYWQKPNTAMAAVPGTSNHGFGLAVDMALGDSPSSATSIGPASAWLEANVVRFGFSYEAQSEPWHVRLFTGDHIPQAVLDHEHPTTPDPEDDDMKPVFIGADDGRQGLWVPGSPIQPFADPVQRDNVLAYLGVDPNAGLTVSGAQFDRLS